MNFYSLPWAKSFLLSYYYAIESFAKTHADHYVAQDVGAI